MNFLQMIAFFSIIPGTFLLIGYCFDCRTRTIHRQNKLVRARNEVVDRQNQINAEMSYVSKEMNNVVRTRKVPVVKTMLSLLPGEFVTRVSESKMHLPRFNFNDSGTAYLTNHRLIFAGAQTKFEVSLPEIISLEEDIELGCVMISSLKAESVVVLSIDHPLMWRTVYDSFKSKDASFRIV